MPLSTSFRVADVKRLVMLRVETVMDNFEDPRIHYLSTSSVNSFQCQLGAIRVVISAHPEYVEFRITERRRAVAQGKHQAAGIGKDFVEQKGTPCYASLPLMSQQTAKSLCRSVNPASSN